MNNKKIIALDVDGVIADWDAMYRPVISDILGKKLNYNDCFDHNLAKSYGVSDEEMRLAGRKAENLCNLKNMAVIDGAKGAFLTLNKKFEIVIITSRPKIHENETISWVNKNFGDLKIIFTKGVMNPYVPTDRALSKLDACKKIGAVCLIEDNPYELLTLEGGPIEPICVAHPWNKMLDDQGSNIFRGSWQDITEYLLKKYT